MSVPGGQPPAPAHEAEIVFYQDVAWSPDAGKLASSAMRISRALWEKEQFGALRKSQFDIHLIMPKYIDAGGLDRLSSDAKDLIEAEGDIGIELPRARLLGRDIALIVSQQTLETLGEILKREASGGVESRLVIDMIEHGSFFREGAFERGLHLLQAVELGLGKRTGKKS